LPRENKKRSKQTLKNAFLIKIIKIVKNLFTSMVVWLRASTNAILTQRLWDDPWPI